MSVAFKLHAPDMSGPWNIAVVRKWVEIASEKEISNAIDIPCHFGSALCMSAAKDHEIEGMELVHILMVAGANPTAKDIQHGGTTFHTAAMFNDIKLLKNHPNC